ncbi:MAG: FAD-dependent thymidylate synthase [Deltaproteobacteria bacterium]|nr:FAD-dependent thymidylate synthase [Deltaproteobacteria bacterium]
MHAPTDLEPLPVVRLVNAFDLPFDNAVATARTCYSSRVINPEEVSKDDQARERRDAIARSTYQAGHHTTLQHASFQFALERVSRQLIWSFLHAHPFYNSEQVSQRYVEVKPGAVSIPALGAEARGVFTGTVEAQMRAYHELVELLAPVVEGEYTRIFPARAKRLDQDPRWRSAIKKRSQEVARYVLPVATHAHLYHTVSGLTLHRYHRLCQQLDVPAEARLVVELMVAEVNKVDPLFFREIEDPIPLEETHEAEALRALGDEDDLLRADRFVADFDRRLAGGVSRLADLSTDPEETIARAVRTVLGVSDAELSTEAALARVLDPAQNAYLSNALTLTTMGKLTRVLSHAHFTFEKKLSHTADSQDQRHRMVPGSRPVLARQVRLKTPDYVVPALISAAPEQVQARYRDTMERTWAAMGRLAQLGTPIEQTLYLLPNAFPIRFTESGDLLHFHHKWTSRLCYTAQEEIWAASLEEVREVRTRAPRLARWLTAPCGLRSRAAVRPVCPEGDRFCGVKVWGLDLEAYHRVI